MGTPNPRRVIVISILACFSLHASPAPANADVSVPQIEQSYADAVDAVGILTTIDSGLFKVYQGKGRAEWEQIYREKRNDFAKGVATVSTASLSAADLHALSIMRRACNQLCPKIRTIPPAIILHRMARARMHPEKLWILPHSAPPFTLASTNWVTNSPFQESFSDSRFGNCAFIANGRSTRT